MTDNYDILEALAAIDPTTLDYSEWTAVGMALKDTGHSVSAWDDWSRQDARRYHEGECSRKWDTFRGSASPVTAGTIISIARDHGWTPPLDEGYELSWDSIIGSKDEQVIIDAGWVEAVDIEEPADWDPVKDLTTYLEVLFEANENVGYVTTSWEKDDRYLPSKGNWDRTAGELIQALNRAHDIQSVLGDYKDEAGAWIRFNPLDGRGCKNDNVTEFRYALVESDTMDLAKQSAIIRSLELPVACLVYSGGKSVHAIVRIDAPDYDEYRKRVDYLYGVCKKNGLSVDSQNKNPSRLSRLPGATRNGHKQFLMATNIGRENWAEWRDWIEKVNDELPDPENLASVWDDLPELSPPLIDGVLRQGHKMLLAGPSKAGKSFALIELCCAIAEGRDWLGWDCAKGRVLYVNLELDKASCLHRFKDVYTALEWDAGHRSNVTIWNLRGHATSLDKLAPKLIRRAAQIQPLAIIIDPIYKVITGDENSADQMAQFCNYFDMVATQLGCAVIYCHHHSKGSQGQKRSADRASGSGVFARDPDTLIDLIELDLTEAIIKQQINDAQCAHISAFLDARAEAKGWREQVPRDATVSEKAFRSACVDLLGHGETMSRLIAELAAVERQKRSVTGWRIEGTLREFPKFAPVNLWFDYPTHHVDTAGILKDLDADGVLPVYKKATDKRKKAAAAERQKKSEALADAVANANFGDAPTTAQAMAYMGLDPKEKSDHDKFDHILKTGEEFRRVRDEESRQWIIVPNTGSPGDVS